MKKIISIVMAVSMLACVFSTCALAASNSTSYVNDESVYDMFITAYSAFFSEPEKYSIISNNEIITDSFYNAYVDSYLDGDYQIIYDAVRNNNYGLRTITKISTSSGARVAISEEYSVSDQYYTLQRFDGINSNAGVTLLMVVSGTYIVNLSTDTIYSYSGATLNIYRDDPGDWYALDYIDRTTSATLSANKKTVTFFGSFRLRVDYNDSVGNSIVRTYGPYSLSVPASV